MEEVIRLFKQIQETSSTNGKKAIIKANKDNELFNTFKNLAPQNNIINSVLLQGKLPFVIEVSEDVFYIPYEVTKRSNKSVLRYGTKRFLANYTPVYDPELGCSYCAVRD